LLVAGDAWDRRQARSGKAARRRWRDYRTRSGRRPVKDFLDKLPADHAVEIAAGMNDVRRSGLRVARHLRGDIWEVRVDHGGLAYRILFAPEGRRGQILLSLEAFSKKREKTPQAKIELAEQRLKDWRRRRRV
jgi:phage-related protein